MNSVSFAILVLEREPPRWQDLVSGWTTWLQVVGGAAAVGLALWALFFLLRGRKEFAARPQYPWQPALFWSALVLAVVLYAVGGFLQLEQPDSAQAGLWYVLGGTCALIGLGAPFVADMLRLRPRRIWALTRLSLQEAIRRRVLWVYLALLLVFLFASWFLPTKPEDQVRTYVQVVFGAMTPLLLVTAGLVAAFSIPADVQQQTIHTIVTKPVERFEIVLGRFLGFTLLMSAVLVGLTGVSLIYIFREINPKAAAESLRARVPLYGRLELEDAGRRDFQGRAIGREWRYRRYIGGGPDSLHRAVWVFPELPADLSTRPRVPCEFAFDIFRMSRGQEAQKGVLCTLSFRTWQWQEERQRKQYEQERASAGLDPAALDQLAEKYGIYEDTRKVIDYHTLQVEVPGGLFRNAQAAGRGRLTPALEVQVKCEDRGQYLGVARSDLYLLEADGSFSANFFKGAVGLWCRLCLVIGIAVACSTFLTGVVSWLLAMFLYGAGLFQGFIRELALGKDEAGFRTVGPTEAAIGFASRTPGGVPLEATPTVQVATALDEAYRWFLRNFLLNVVPDVDRFSWTNHVAEGFNVSLADLAINLLMLITYLLPWAVLAYYLIKNREVAS
jgi:hypothetical protein